MLFLFKKDELKELVPGEDEDSHTKSVEKTQSPLKVT